MGKNKQDPWNGARWLAIDPDGAIHARIFRCSRDRAAAIARVLFPEEESLRIVGFPVSDWRLIERAEAAPLLTPESCERQDIPLPAEERPPVTFLAGRLKQRFPRVQARSAGGGR